MLDAALSYASALATRGGIADWLQHGVGRLRQPWAEWRAENRTSHKRTDQQALHRPLATVLATQLCSYPAGTQRVGHNESTALKHEMVSAVGNLSARGGARSSDLCGHPWTSIQIEFIRITLINAASQHCVPGCLGAVVDLRTFAWILSWHPSVMAGR